jgi:hypothetical protein
MVENLEGAARMLSVAKSKADKMSLQNTDTRAYQQLNNAIVRLDACLELLDT